MSNDHEMKCLNSFICVEESGFYAFKAKKLTFVTLFLESIEPTRCLGLKVGATTSYQPARLSIYLFPIEFMLTFYNLRW